MYMTCVPRSSIDLFEKRDDRRRTRATIGFLADQGPELGPLTLPSSPSSLRTCPGRRSLAVHLQAHPAQCQSAAEKSEGKRRIG